jgi:2-methylisocitrate lyase-like PEP mutase family enzyme
VSGCCHLLVPMKTTTQLRELIHGAEILQLPCCHDGLSARILEQAGFKAIAAAGYGLAGWRNRLCRIHDDSRRTLLSPTAPSGGLRQISSRARIGIAVGHESGYDYHRAPEKPCQSSWLSDWTGGIL